MCTSRRYYYYYYYYHYYYYYYHYYYYYYYSACMDVENTGLSPRESGVGRPLAGALPGPPGVCALLLWNFHILILRIHISYKQTYVFTYIYIYIYDIVYIHIICECNACIMSVHASL